MSGLARLQRMMFWPKVRPIVLLLVAASLIESPAWPEPIQNVAATESALHSSKASLVQPSFAAVDTAPTLEAKLDDASTLAQIGAQPICFGSSVWSFGEMGKTVLFVYQRTGTRLAVGYFVYFSTERPWGANALTYSLLPALFLDMTYSHFLFVMPGLQRVLYGPGDVEGVTVVYDETPEGTLSPRAAYADDGAHELVSLTARDIYSEGRVVLMTDVWSHQLGASGAAAHAARSDARLRCFQGETLLPLTSEIAGQFRLGTPKDPRRARPAFRALQ